VQNICRDVITVFFGRNAVYGIFQFLPKMTFFAVSNLEIRKKRKNKARKKNLKKNFLMKKKLKNLVSQFF